MIKVYIHDGEELQENEGDFILHGIIEGEQAKVGLVGEASSSEVVAVMGTIIETVLGDLKEKGVSQERAKIILSETVNVAFQDVYKSRVVGRKRR